MLLTPERAISDLNQYVASFGYRLSTSARNVFEFVEQFSAKINTIPLQEPFALALFEASPSFRDAVKQLSRDFNAAYLIVKEEAEGVLIDYYDTEPLPYSELETRRLATRTRVLDLCLAIAQKNGRKDVLDLDIVEALFEAHSETFPSTENKHWKDKKLRTAYNGLCHLVAHYDPALDIPFADVLRRLEIEVSPKSPVEQAPAAARQGVLGLLQDHPDYHRNCFVIMAFTEKALYSAIFEAIKETLIEFGFVALRADSRSYSDDLLHNIQAYLYGCSFAVAVLDRVETDVYNPNVAFEVGYMNGLNKPVCLLKDRTLKGLHSDIVGRLYVQFDAQSADSSIRLALKSWLKDHRLI